MTEPKMFVGTVMTGLHSPDYNVKQGAFVLPDDLLRLRAYALVSYFDEDGAVDRFGVLANRPCLAELVDELRDALTPVDDSSPQAALDS